MHTPNNYKITSSYSPYDFGGDFGRWVSVLMRDAKSCVSYCGWLSDFLGG